jgi:3-deoxy-alpha-D-manno-octulosonate 8-oxidase
MFKNFKNIDKVVFGRGSFSMMEGILEERRNVNDGFFLYVVDNFFK